MSGVESIVVLGLLVLLAIGIALMFAPLGSGEDAPGLLLRDIEPQVGEEDQLVDFRYSIAQIQCTPDSGTETEAPVSEDEALLPMDNSDEDLALEESMNGIDDELFYLIATDEVDSDQRQPALWAKVIALNFGDEQKARFHYIRLRAAQMVRNQPPATLENTPGKVMEVTEIVPPVAGQPASDGGDDAVTDVPQETPRSDPDVDADTGHQAESLGDDAVTDVPQETLRSDPDVDADTGHQAESLGDDAVADVPQETPRSDPDVDADTGHQAENPDDAEQGYLVGSRPVPAAQMLSESQLEPEPEPFAECLPAPKDQPETAVEQGAVADQISIAAAQPRSAGHAVVEAEIEAAMQALSDAAPPAGSAPPAGTQSAPESKTMAEDQSVPEVKRSVRVKRVAGETSASRLARAAGGEAFGPILNRALVVEVIEAGRLIGNLIRSADLLKDFLVARYVTSDDVRSSRSGKVDHWPEASAYFDHYQHRTAVNLGDSLERFDKKLVRSYLLARQFPHQLGVDFFDEALVITILPGSPQMEFLVLVPGGGLGDPLSARFLASSRITELFMAAGSGSGNPLSLYVELDLLLERLRIG
jgi:hypothetical protein